MVARVLGALRLHLGRELELIDETPGEFLWVTDFPLFEWDEDEQRWTAVHHPFTRPTDETLELVDTDPGEARAVAYDLVVNGIELGRRLVPDPRAGPAAASLRPPRDLDRRSSGRSSASCSTRSRWARRRTAASPRASTGSRWRCSTSRTSATRVAFPKNQAGVDPMTGAPTPIPQDLLAELGIQVLPKTE